MVKKKKRAEQPVRVRQYPFACRLNSRSDIEGEKSILGGLRKVLEMSAQEARTQNVCVMKVFKDSVVTEP